MDTLRPQSWDEYIGQKRVKRELGIRIDAALQEDRALDPILLMAPPGVGKTSLAGMIAERAEEALIILTMPVTTKYLVSVMLDWEGAVLFDEIHRCSTKEQETLLPLLEFGYIQDGHRRIDSHFHAIIGATTERQKLIEPLIDRFPVRPDFDEYTDDEMAKIVQGMARKLDIDMSFDVARSFGVAATGTPRKARQFVQAYRDLRVTMEGNPSVDDVLNLCRTTSDGLTLRHIRYMETLKALGGTKGIEVLSNLLRESTSELKEIERLLVDKGYLSYGERGRELTSEGMRRIRAERIAS